MRRKCGVSFCKSSDESRSYHRIPQDESQRRVWTQFLVKTNGQREIPAGTFICSAHFKPCCFTSSSLERRKVLPGHAPSLECEPCPKTQAEHVVELSEVDHLRNQLTKAQADLVKLRTMYDKAIEELRVLRQYKSRHELKRKFATDHKETCNPKIPKHDDEFETSILNQLINKCHRAYSEPVKQFAYKLHFYSPRAYWFLRDMLGKSLPHPRTFTKWTQHIVTSPGFLDVSLQFISQRSLNHTHLLYYALIFDEVSIRQQILHHSNQIKGYVDYGNIVFKVPSDTGAKSALFILASEINGDKKVPIGYILTNGLDSALFSEVVSQCLARMAEIQAKVLSVTFDGLRSNFNGMEKLGAQLDVMKGDLVPFIRNPITGSKVYVFPDPCHMYKLMRNTLEKLGSFYNEDGSAIRWNYLSDLMKLQCETGLRAANKISSRHIYFDNQKMKVKLCTQLFSNSVSVALTVCRKLEIEEFMDSEATSEFLSMMDRHFDILNSKRSGTGFKSPLRQNNRHFWLPLFEKVRTCLLQLKYKAKGDKLNLIHTSSYGTFIKGLLVSMKSLEMIMAEVVAENNSDLEYLPAYKLSQDLLEMFFSVLRSRYGFNNNPNVLQLEQGLRSILCCNLQPSLSANATPQDSTTRISALGSMKALRNPSETFEQVEDEDDEETPPLSPFITNIITYIAGFVGRALLPKQVCPICAIALFPTTELRSRQDFMLLNEKDNGGLFVPNNDIIQVCRSAEQEVRREIPNGISTINKKKLVHKVLRACTNEDIFQSLRSETGEGHGWNSDHVLVLIRSIAEEYLKIRLHHLCKEVTHIMKPTTNRNTCTKSVHFMGN